VTLYNWARPRGLARYEHYHATAAMQVEALWVTPYARRAPDREFAGTFVAAVRNLVGLEYMNAAVICCFSWWRTAVKRRSGTRA
jgi:hypothetical protein